jgi:Mechanosensitive ion channel, conserved TM helix
MITADISTSAERSLDVFFDWLPNLVGALIILIVGWIVARVIAGLVRKALGRAGLDRTLTEGAGGQWISRVVDRPSHLLGTIAFWAVFVGAISLAVSVLGVEALQDFLAAVYAYLPNVLAALAIFIVASLIAAAVARVASRLLGDTALARMVATAGPILVMAIATFMILDQLQIAPTIVTITYAALLGALALGSALAFGLGGREVARDMLTTAYDRGRERTEEVKRERWLQKERARQDMESQSAGEAATGDTRIAAATRGTTTDR